MTQTDAIILCVGYYWTEAEGKEFPEKQRRKYATENLPGILNTHGHWAELDDYGRYRPDA